MLRNQQARPAAIKFSLGGCGTPTVARTSNTSANTMRIVPSIRVYLQFDWMPRQAETAVPD
jgi:hypothetical protein